MMEQKDSSESADEEKEVALPFQELRDTKTQKSNGFSSRMIKHSQEKNGLEGDGDPKESAFIRRTMNIHTDSNDKAVTTNRYEYPKSDVAAEIPDLDDIMQEGNEAPASVTRRSMRHLFPTLKELDSKLNFLIKKSRSGIDMGVLTDTLVPENQIVENDELWDFETLMQDVARNFCNDWGAIPVKNILQNNNQEAIPSSRRKSAFDSSRKITEIRKQNLA